MSLHSFEKMQRELKFLARRQRWDRMKKHQPRPSGSDADTDEQDLRFSAG